MRYIFSPSDVEPINLPGREMRRIISEETVGTKSMSVGVIWVPPGEAVLPCHSHDADEALYIVSGEGQSWIDNQLDNFKAGDVVWFPKNCKHMIRNNGSEILQAVHFFSPARHPKEYTLYPEIKFED